MSDFNSCNFFGHIVRDAEMKTKQNGIKVSEFTVANNLSKKNVDGTFDNEASFFNLAIFGEYAEKMLPYLKKGQKVIIEGRLRQTRWEENGEKKSRLSVSVKKIQLINSTKQGENNSSADKEEETEFYPENAMIMDSGNTEIGEEIY